MRFNLATNQIGLQNSHSNSAHRKYERFSNTNRIVSEYLSTSYKKPIIVHILFWRKVQYVLFVWGISNLDHVRMNSSLPAESTLLVLFQSEIKADLLVESQQK